VARLLLQHVPMVACDLVFLKVHFMTSC
jgi:hypothetical protein